MGFVVLGRMLAASFLAIFLIRVTFYLAEKPGEKKQVAPMTPTAAAPAQT